MRNFTSCLAYLTPMLLMFIAAMLSIPGDMDLLALGYALGACMSYYPCVCMGHWLWRDE